MTWHTVTVAAEQLGGLLATIRGEGGTVTRCCPCAAGFEVTWTRTA
jgi:hypothetical protein